MLISGVMVSATLVSSLIIFLYRNDSLPRFMIVPAELSVPVQDEEQEIPLLQPEAWQDEEEKIEENLSLGTLAFIIDDAGNNLWELEPFLHFPGPLTIAVLPGLPNSAEAAQRIRAAGKEVFLHQPMESLGGSYPGPGAIFTGMEEDEIRSIINDNIDEIWPVAGMNNHEGSRISMDEEIMEIILTICRERDIVYLDSRTTGETVAPAAALRLDMRIGERDVFLDNDPDRESIIGYIKTGLSKAGQNGSAIMIGHTFTPGLASLLEEQYSLWITQNFTLSTVSELINGLP